MTNKKREIIYTINNNDCWLLLVSVRNRANLICALFSSSSNIWYDFNFSIKTVFKNGNVLCTWKWKKKFFAIKYLKGYHYLMIIPLHIRNYCCDSSYIYKSSKQEEEKGRKLVLVIESGVSLTLPPLSLQLRRAVYYLYKWRYFKSIVDNSTRIDFWFR